MYWLISLLKFLQAEKKITTTWIFELSSFSVDEMFVKINEEESEDEGSDQETNGQLEMESRHSESDGQTENGQTESDGQAENRQA